MARDNDDAGARRRTNPVIDHDRVGVGDKTGQATKCIRRESNPELGHGKTQCYRYTMNAIMVNSCT